MQGYVEWEWGTAPVENLELKDGRIWIVCTQAFNTVKTIEAGNYPFHLMGNDRTLVLTSWMVLGTTLNVIDGTSLRFEMPMPITPNPMPPFDPEEVDRAAKRLMKIHSELVE